MWPMDKEKFTHLVTASKVLKPYIGCPLVRDDSGACNKFE